MTGLTYRETAWFNERRFTLEETRLRFTGRKRFGSIVEQTIPLDTLQPEPARIWARNTTLESGVAWGSLAAIVLCVLVPFLGQFQKHDPEAWLRTIWVLIVVVLAAGGENIGARSMRLWRS